MIRFSARFEPPWSRGTLPGYNPGRILALQSGFVPEPLVAIMLSDGFQIWTQSEGPGRFTTFYSRG